MVPEEVSNLHGTETNRTQQHLIHDYISKHYKLASGMKKKTPYKVITTNLSSFVAAEFWPSNVIFKEPSKYGSRETNSILCHLYKRQKDSLVSFHFDYVPIANKVEIENYLEGIFDIALVPALVPPPTKQKSGCCHKTTMKGWSDSDDSEEYNSQNDNEGNRTEPELGSDKPELGSDEIPLTLLESHTDTESLGRWSQSPLKCLYTKGGGTHSPSNRSREVTEDTEGTQESEEVAAVTQKKGKGKAAALPPVQSHMTRARTHVEAPPTRGTRSQTGKT